MTVKEEVYKFIAKALPMVEYGEITINIKVHQGKISRINKGILEEAKVEEGVKNEKNISK